MHKYYGQYFKGWKRSCILVQRNKQNSNDNFVEMKIQKLSTNFSPFAGISFANNEFNTTGVKWPSLAGAMGL